MAQISGLVGRSFLAALLLFSLLQTALSIQVAPNSPCASLCIDDSSLDVSDPNSSNTVNDDIACYDTDFASTASGKKWSSCMACLQNSTFSQGTESDQAWFFYNLRYNIDYCVFGYPNASDIGSSPCQTSTACGPLQDALVSGIPAMGNYSEYDYCSVDGSVLTSDSLSGCLDCVVSTGDTTVIANALIALEAGCLQKLAPSEAVGLSGSVFTTATTISIVSPTASGSGSSSGSSGGSHSIATTTIVVIAVVCVLLCLAVAGFGFVCYRKRQGRTVYGKQATAGGRDKGGGGGARATGSIGTTKWTSQFPSSNNITLPLSFQANVSGYAGSYAGSVYSEAGFQEKVQEKLQKVDVRDFVRDSVRDAGPDAGPDAATSSSSLSSRGSTVSRSGSPDSQQLNASSASTAPSLSGKAARLPAIAESPLPSPAPPAGAARTQSGSGRLQPSSSLAYGDNNSNGYRLANMATLVRPQQAVVTGAQQPLPQLQQLKTSFSPTGAPSVRFQQSANTPNSSDSVRGASAFAFGLASRDSPSMYNTPTSATPPTSATALLAHAANAAAWSSWSSGGTPSSRHQTSAFAPYNPADYTASPQPSNDAASRRSAYPVWPAVTSSPVSTRSASGFGPGVGLGLGAATMAARHSVSSVSSAAQEVQNQNASVELPGAPVAAAGHLPSMPPPPPPPPHPHPHPHPRQAPVRPKRSSQFYDCRPGDAERRASAQRSIV